MKQVLIAVDQLFNAIFAGMADETISARAWREEQSGSKRWGYARKSIDLLFFFERNHCAMSYSNEFTRKHLPSVYRGASE